MAGRTVFLFIVVLFLCMPGISADGKQRKNTVRLKIVNWNVQTFFDAHRDGSEYPEFRKARSGWNKGSYTDRVVNLCNAVTALDGDVVVLEEIENKGILYDISNGLARNAWFRKKTYRYACFASAPGGALGCAVLSRYPLSAASVHSLDIRCTDCMQPGMRPVLAVTVSAGRQKCILLVNHWKSKSGNERENSIWRQYQESVLAQCIAAFLESSGGDQAILACGDFNQDIAEFHEAESGSSCIQLDRSMTGGNGCVTVYSPWLDRELCHSAGSYYFHDTWERLDHFFTAGKIKITAFKAESDGPWADREGKPYAYQLYRKKGYSDHLPVSCVIELAAMDSE